MPACIDPCFEMITARKIDVIVIFCEHLPRCIINYCELKASKCFVVNRSFINVPIALVGNVCGINVSETSIVIESKGAVFEYKAACISTNSISFVARYPPRTDNSLVIFF